jgi:hypothetical protein
MEDVMKPLRNLVVALLLTVWIAPSAAHGAVPLAATGTPGAPSSAPARTPTGAAVSPSALLALGATEVPGEAAGGQQEAEALAAREKAAPGLQDYRGGAAYIYIGGGATLILVLILLIILL